MRILILAGIALILLHAAGSAPAADKKVDSVYTDISGAECSMVELDEEIGSSHLRCPGVGGYRLDLHDFDARMTLDVLSPEGKTHPLDFSQVITWGFSALGEKAEWRTVGGKPVALIVRVNASEDPVDSTKITSYLAVTKITAEKICVVAKIPPSAAANEEARKVADGAASQPCLAPPS